MMFKITCFYYQKIVLESKNDCFLEKIINHFFSTLFSAWGPLYNRIPIMISYVLFIMNYMHIKKD